METEVRIVYASIASVEDTPEWRLAGGVESISEAEAIVPTPQNCITLLGTSHPRREVAVYRAICGRGPDWRDTGEWHMQLAKFFMQKLKEAPRGGSCLRPFFSEIDDPAAKHAAQQLVARLCGINAPDVEFGDMHRAILDINSELAALGVPTGDWTFDPIRAAFREIRID